MLQSHYVTTIPHPIPYQGSKRILAPIIAGLIPDAVDVFFEPFAGSAAMTLYVAHKHKARKFIIGDSLEPIIELWRSIIDQPQRTAARYESLWKQQARSKDHFNRVRDRYNAEHDPVDLLYLVCRCVKNAVRFGANGRFTQSADKRRKGMAPDKMGRAINGASVLLRGKVELRIGDWMRTVADVRPRDFVYLDPPYLGTTEGRDKRYHQQLQRSDLIYGLQSLTQRDARFALSYDGMTGNKEYGPPLPTELGLYRILLHAGRSSQATLNGRADTTIESLYLSPTIPAPTRTVIELPKDRQQSLSL